jgi:hypothetical protein
MARIETNQQTPRLLARFVLHGSAEGYSGRMPMPAGDYVAEMHLVGDDLEVLMFAPRDERRQPRG